jgi:hypothetical protein
MGVGATVSRRCAMLIQLGGPRGVGSCVGRMLHHLRNREKNTYQWEGDVDVVISDLEEVITNVGAPLKIYRRCFKRTSHTSVRI